MAEFINAHPVLKPVEIVGLLFTETMSTTIVDTTRASRPNKTFAKPIETFFELSVVSAPFSSKKQNYDRT